MGLFGGGLHRLPFQAAEANLSCRENGDVLGLCGADGRGVNLLRISSSGAARVVMVAFCVVAPSEQVHCAWKRLAVVEAIRISFLKRAEQAHVLGEIADAGADQNMHMYCGNMHWGNVLMQALAAAYPQQLHWPFRLSRGHYGPEGVQRAAELEPLLGSALLEAFGGALSATTYPAQRWEGWTQQLARLLGGGKQARTCRAGARAAAPRRGGSRAPQVHPSLLTRLHAPICPCQSAVRAHGMQFWFRHHLRPAGCVCLLCHSANALSR